MRLLVLVLVFGLAGTSSAEGLQVGGMTVYGATPVPCLGEPLTPDLYEVELQRLADSGEALEGAAVEQLSRSRACLDGLVPPADLAFVHGAEDGTQEASATLKIVAPLGVLVWLDGAPMVDDEIEVIAGLRLIQVGSGPAAPVRSLLIEVERDARVFVTVPASVVQRRTTVGLERVPDRVTFSTSRTAPVFLVVGAGLAAIGGVVTAVGAHQLAEFNDGVRSGSLSPFPQSSAVNPEDSVLYRVWQSHTRDVTVGCALMGVGAGVMVVSIPIGLAHRSAQIGVTAAVPLAPGGPRGFALGVVVR